MNEMKRGIDPNDHVYTVGSDLVHVVNAVYVRRQRVVLWCQLNSNNVECDVDPAGDAPISCLGCIAAMP